MSQPYVGEIRLFGGNFAPNGWLFCDGSLLSIADNTTLFTLIGTTYGGDGQQTFALPDLRGRAPVHQGAGPGLSARVIGQVGGAETVTLTAQTMPAHSHALEANSAAATAASGPTGVLAATVTNMYGSGAPSTPMAANAITPAGGTQPHENMAPYAVVSYIISLYGIFPSQN